MNKEEYIYNLLDKLDLDEWCTDLYKVPLTWCELYDIRDYINSLQQELDKYKHIVEEIKDLFNTGHFEDGCDCIIMEDVILPKINKLEQESEE